MIFQVVSHMASSRGRCVKLNNPALGPPISPNGRYRNAEGALS